MGRFLYCIEPCCGQILNSEHFLALLQSSELQQNGYAFKNYITTVTNTLAYYRIVEIIEENVFFYLIMLTLPHGYLDYLYFFNNFFFQMFSMFNLKLDILIKTKIQPKNFYCCSISLNRKINVEQLSNETFLVIVNLRLVAKSFEYRFHAANI